MTPDPNNKVMNVTGTVRWENGTWRAIVSLVTVHSTTTGEAGDVQSPDGAIGLAAHFAWKERA